MPSDVSSHTRSNTRNKTSRSKDRHRSKGGDRHINRNKDSGHRCICGYDKCHEVRDGFKGTGHPYDRPPIYFICPEACGEWEDFFESLVRNLHVRESKEKGIRERGKGCRFNVSAHHFSEAAVKKYWDPKNTHHAKKIWSKRFDLEEAKELLHHPLDPRDRDTNNQYWINANITQWWMQQN